MPNNAAVLTNADPADEVAMTVTMTKVLAVLGICTVILAAAAMTTSAELT